MDEQDFDDTIPREELAAVARALAGATAVAAAIVFALSSGGGGHPARPEAAASALRTTTAASSATDASGATAPSTTHAMKVQAPSAKRCAPASRRGGARPRAGCPGARGGHARAV